MAKKPTKRISFTATEAEHLYEWLCMYWKGQPMDCWECKGLGKRLERIIGPTDVRRIKRLIKKSIGPLVGAM